MADVLNFPPKLERNWRAVEAMLRGMLNGVPHDAVELQYGLDRIKPTFLESARSLGPTLDPSDADACMAALNAWVTDVVCTALMRLLIAELELYRLRGPVP